MKTRILNLLNLSPEEYEDKTLNTWVHWCVSKASGSKSLQKTLISQPLFNWWKKELEKLELEFIQDMEALQDHNPKGCMQAYNFTTKRIYNHFSKPLIKKAHDNQTIGKQN